MVFPNDPGKRHVIYHGGRPFVVDPVCVKGVSPQGHGSATHGRVCGFGHGLERAESVMQMLGEPVAPGNEPASFADSGQCGSAC